MRTNITREQAEKILQRIFGISHFYDEQWEAISRLMRGEKVLMIQRTGFGKSLCYQFPATQLPGVTIVFSPLIALMRDQIKSLRSKGISAGLINSEQSIEENQQTLHDAIKGQLKILYIAPERQENAEWQEAVRHINISMLVIDEAHTISTWGHDFRPAFRRIIHLVKLLPEHCPVLATTATATQRVQNDIEQQIGGGITTLRGSLARSNFSLYVIRVKSEEEKMIWLADHLNHIEGSGIIYVGTRLNTELYSKWLQQSGISATEYNARFDADTRKSVEKGLMDNKWKCIISTNALGMGIDKPDIRFIIHTQIPQSPIHYYQEIGRAGRDGKPTVIILFYNESISPSSGKETDSLLPTSFIENARPSESKYKQVINLIKEEPLTERQIQVKANLKQTQVRTIKADLIEQGVTQEVVYDNKKHLELISSTSPDLFDYAKFQLIKAQREKELAAMIDYVKTSKPRMKFLCRFLDSDEDAIANNCDNTNLKRFIIDKSPVTEQNLKEFQSNLFPKLSYAEKVYTYFYAENGKERLDIKYISPNLLEVCKDYELIGRENDLLSFQTKLSDKEYGTLDFLHAKLLDQKSHITDGVAAAYYGESIVGTAIHRCKYGNGGDFPDFLLRRTLKAFYHAFRSVTFDVVMYVPPTMSGNLVRNFATKFASAICVPISHSIVKEKENSPQKIFQNAYSKRANVSGVFNTNDDVTGKTILLIDDVADSGATLKEVGVMLSQKGAKFICPLVIAKTIGGTDE